MGVDLMHRGSGLDWAASWLQSRAELALIPLQSEPRSSHDRAAIRPRSCRDRASIVMLVLKRSPSESVGRIVALILPQRNPDRGTIGPRSHHDRGSYSSVVCRSIEIKRSPIAGNAKSLNRPMKNP